MIDAHHRCRRWLTALPLLACAATQAHDRPYTLATLAMDGTRYELTLSCHVAALLTGMPQGHLPAAARNEFAMLTEVEIRRRATAVSQYLREAVWIEVDGQRIHLHAPLMPSVVQLRADAAQTPETQRPSEPIRFRGELPVSARQLRIAVPPAFSDVLLRPEGTSTEGPIQALTPGAWSRPMLRRIPASELSEPGVTARQYLWLGYLHVLPRGLDHILFIVAMAAVARPAARLVLEATAFTVAHSATLALTVLGVLDPAPRIVETLIAVSIVVVALANLGINRAAPSRSPLILAFGLMHGLGFGSVLRELGLPAGQTVLALAAFNAGIEFAQLTVLSFVLLAACFWAARPWYQRGFVVPLSLGIALVAGNWAIQRAWP